MSICQYCSERGLCHFSCLFPFLWATKNICVVVQWIESRSMSGLKLLLSCCWWWTRSHLDLFLSQACYTGVGMDSWWGKSCSLFFWQSTSLNWISSRNSFLFNLFLCISSLFLLNVYGELVSSLLSCTTWKY